MIKNIKQINKIEIKVCVGEAVRIYAPQNCN